MSYHSSDPKVAKKRKKNRAKSGPIPFEVSIQKTNSHVTAVIYDKFQKRDIGTISTRSKSVTGYKNKTEAAFLIGGLVSDFCKKHNITSVYFNKLNYKFHGILVEFVRGMRESGIIL